MPAEAQPIQTIYTLTINIIVCNKSAEMLQDLSGLTEHRIKMSPHTASQLAE